VFKSKDPLTIARSLKRSAEQSKRHKSTPYQSAMSMLNFYINRAGKNLPQAQKRVLWNEPKMNCAMSLAERRRRREAAQALQNFREIRFMPARNLARSALGMRRSATGRIRCGELGAAFPCEHWLTATA
jgi:hypothetical protein